MGTITKEQEKPDSKPNLLVINAMLAGLYLLTGLLALSLPTSPVYPAGFWPPAGIAMGGVLRWGRGTLPGIFIGSALLHGLRLPGWGVDGSAALVPVLIIAIGSVLQAGLGARLITGFISATTRLLRLRSIILFCIIGIGSGLIGSTAGLGALCLAGLCPFPLFTWSAWWIGEGIGILLFAPVMLRPTTLRDENWRWRRVMIPAALVPISAGVFAVQAIFANLTTKRFTESFRAGIDDIKSEIEKSSTTYGEVLYGMRGFYQSSLFIDRDEFRQFTSHSLSRHSGIHALEWAPVVPHRERTDFEEKTGEELQQAYHIFERNPEGEKVPAVQRSSYTPVLYAEPAEDNQAALGLDLSSDAIRKTALDRALQQNAPAATAPVNLVQDEEPVPALLVSLPVYQSNEEGDPTRQLSGFVVGVFRIQDMMAPGIDLAHRKHLRMEASDRDAEAGRRSLYTCSEEAGTAISGLRFDLDLPHRETLDVAGRTWSLSFEPMASFFSSGALAISWLAMMGNGVLSLLFSAFLLILAGRNAQIATKVAEATDELQEEVKRRTKTQRELEHKNRELEQTQLNLERLNQNLQHFAYAVSHDLKEPVRTVNNFAQLIEQDYSDKLDDDGREFIGFITSAAHRMQDLIGGLLSFSQVETKAGSITGVDTGEVLRDVLDDLMFMIEQSGAEVKVLNPLPEITGDRVQVHQLMQNLIGNAIKYRATDQQALIEVSSEPLADGAHRFTIQDNGIGIAEHQHERIFQVFQRLHRDDEYEGVGIGLAICKRIVDRHGGDIGVESQPGTGAAFWFTLPESMDGEAFLREA